MSLESLINLHKCPILISLDTVAHSTFHTCEFILPDNFFLIFQGCCIPLSLIADKHDCSFILVLAHCSKAIFGEGTFGILFV